MTVEAREARQPWILLSPALLAVTLLLFVPLAFIVVYSFWLRTATGADVAGFHLDNWNEALTDPFYRDILLNTLKIAAITTIVCAIAGYPAAYFIARSKGNKGLLLLLLMLPFWVSYIIRTMSWINILGVSGAVNSALIWAGVCFALSKSDAPIIFPIVFSLFEALILLGFFHLLFAAALIHVRRDGIGYEKRVLGMVRRGWHARPEIRDLAVLVFDMADQIQEMFRARRRDLDLEVTKALAGLARQEAEQAAEHGAE